MPANSAISNSIERKIALFTFYWLAWYFALAGSELVQLDWQL